MQDTRQQNQEIYGWSLDSLNTSKTASTNGIDVDRNAKEGCRIEGEKYEDIQSEHCPNRTRIRGLQVVLGQLLRVSTVGSSTRTKWESCRFVYPQFHVRNDGSHEPMYNVPEGGGLYESCRNCNSSPMVIEVIANEHERNLFASYVNHGTYKASNLSSIKPGSNLDIYVNAVQEYGFTHIILVGEREHGITFLDCYCRVFELDMMTGVLWPLGDTLKEAATTPWTGEVAWNVDEVGTVFEVEYYGTVSGNQEDQKYGVPFGSKVPKFENPIF
ncbi:hypothetical protein C1645_835369 [Glomus cerebriforme]|uniref:Uncharacterized protein n=1 Tax=Glomus cerebriforme TaxID=658196 RepID=A0A397S7W8_9GLOM|nr:hypothetical protein C1645_835369 [Glomus cerebriforme]